MEQPYRNHRNGQDLRVRLPRHVSPESLYLLVDVFEQIVAQVFDRHDERVAHEIMRLYDQIDHASEFDLHDADLPF